MISMLYGPAAQAAADSMFNVDIDFSLSVVGSVGFHSCGCSPARTTTHMRGERTRRVPPEEVMNF